MSSGAFTLEGRPLKKESLSSTTPAKIEVDVGLVVDKFEVISCGDPLSLGSLENQVEPCHSQLFDRPAKGAPHDQSGERGSMRMQDAGSESSRQGAERFRARQARAVGGRCTAGKGLR